MCTLMALRFSGVYNYSALLLPFPFFFFDTVSSMQLQTIYNVFMLRTQSHNSTQCHGEFLRRDSTTASGCRWQSFGSFRETDPGFNYTSMMNFQRLQEVVLAHNCSVAHFIPMPHDLSPTQSAGLYTTTASSHCSRQICAASCMQRCCQQETSTNDCS